MIIEYAGPATRSAGPGWIHKARAWWNVHTDDRAQVKRAVIDAVKAEVPKGSKVTFMDWYMDTSTYPTVNAWPSVRVIPPEPKHTCGPGGNNGCEHPSCDGNVGN